MTPTHIIEITTKYGQADARAARVLAQLPGIGVNNAKDLRVSSLYELNGSLTKSQATQTAREILADPITQEYRTDKSTPSQAFLVGPHWRIEVWYKPAVTDPAGESVRKAMGDLGLPQPESVRTGTAYRFLGKIGKAQIEKITNKLLANPVVHRTAISQQ
jgi:phosphoribosylformylglycinamidine (FGAM) synthase PurS component